MGGFIVLDDGRALALSNHCHDVAVELIANETPSEDVRDWLMEGRNRVQGPGMSEIDLRTVTAAVREELQTAMRAANSALQAGTASVRGEDRSQLESAFLTLVEMLDRVEAGEPPEQLNPHMREPLPPPDPTRRSGPGW